jgi:hypothetical protein
LLGPIFRVFTSLSAVEAGSPAKKRPKKFCGAAAYNKILIPNGVAKIQ